MATTTKDRWMAYGSLAGAISVALLTFADYQVTNNLATDPKARPGAFTADDGRALRQDLQRQCDTKIANLQHQIDDIETRDDEFDEWRDEHERWGRELSGRNRAMFEEIYRRLP